MVSSKIIAINVDENTLGELTKLFGGDVADQVRSALEGAGVVVPGVTTKVEEKAEPKVEEKPLYAFGEFIEADEDSLEWTGRYYVKGATDISVVYDNDGVDVVVVSGDEDNWDRIEPSGISIFDYAKLSAHVIGNELWVTIPKLVAPENGYAFKVGNFENAPVETDEQDADEQDADEQDGNWCEFCQEQHSS